MDNHTIYVFSKNFSEGDIKKAVDSTMVEIKKILPNADTRYRINHLAYRDTGEPMGPNFIFVKDPRIYNIMVGNNPDGTPRVEKVPKVKAPIDPTKPIYIGKWGDDDDLDSTDVYLQPLVPRPKIGFEDVTYHRGIVQHKDMIDTSFIRAKIDKRLTPLQVKMIFDIYAFYAVSYVPVTGMPVYPKVTQNPYYVYVEFPPGSKDSAFAVLMSKFVTIPPTDGAAQVDLAFFQAYPPGTKREPHH